MNAGSPAASRRSTSARFICWHVLHFPVTLLNLTQTNHPGRRPKYPAYAKADPHHNGTFIAAGRYFSME
jgi:hypothetical protein